jgi:hypothetical protein
MNKLPKVLIYAISLVLLAIGSAVAYQVFTGSNLNYKSDMLGEITIGQGQDQTTLKEFLEKSEAALQIAQATINDQSLAIGRLEANVETFQGQISRLQAMLAQQQSESGSVVQSSEVPLTAELQSASPELAVSRPTDPAKTKSQEAINRQIVLTRNVLKQMSKKK